MASKEKSILNEAEDIKKIEDFLREEEEKEQRAIALGIPVRGRAENQSKELDELSGSYSAFQEAQIFDPRTERIQDIKVISFEPFGSGQVIGPYKKTGRKPVIHLEDPRTGNIIVLDHNKRYESRGPLELKSRHRVALAMVLMGHTSREIAEHLGLNVQTINVLRCSPLFKIELARLEKKIEDKVTDVNTRFRNSGPRAANRILSLIDSPDAKIAIKAAITSLEYGGFKPAEKKEVTHDIGRNVAQAWELRKKAMESESVDYEEKEGDDGRMRRVAPSRESLLKAISAQNGRAVISGKVNPEFDPELVLEIDEAGNQIQDNGYIPDSLLAEDDYEKISAELRDPSSAAAQLFSDLSEKDKEGVLGKVLQEDDSLVESPIEEQIRLMTGT